MFDDFVIEEFVDVDVDVLFLQYCRIVCFVFEEVVEFFFLCCVIQYFEVEKGFFIEVFGYFVVFVGRCGCYYCYVEDEWQ